jgi:hypothetical protein
LRFAVSGNAAAVAPLLSPESLAARRFVAALYCCSVQAARVRLRIRASIIGNEDMRHLRWTTLTAACAAAALVAVATWSAADAQTRRDRTYGVSRNEVSRADVARAKRTRRPTRITVRRERSFLDPGPEVEPMSRSYTDYALPPGGRASVTERWNPTREWSFPAPSPLYLPGCCLDY